MRVGLAADHGGFALKQQLIRQLEARGFSCTDYGATRLDPDDDFPDFVIPLAQAVAHGTVDRGLAVCGSGVGACIVANKIAGVRACLIHDYYSAHQGVEHDQLNLLCLGGSIVGDALAWDLVMAFLNATFTGEARHQRRLDKIAALERQEMGRSNHHAHEPAYHP
jgi:ribose 5-phosphate isomerase B